ncbi:MAG: DUF1553 domain-containing protein [Verrucomicrobiota bacterium]
MDHRLTNIAILAILSAASLRAGAVHGAEKLEFNRDVLPVLADNCFDCHGPDPESRKAGLRLDLLDENAIDILAPGEVEFSLFVERLFTHDETELMPPPESPRQPSEADKEILRRWVEEGAEYETHWAFVAPERPEPPGVVDESWPRNPIDHFVAAHHASAGVEPQKDAEPSVLARRLGLALTGLPPLPEDLDEFEAAYANNPEAAMRDQIDALLDSSAYGEHLAWIWMDASRYADTNGYQGDGNRVMWRWREWLVGTLNQNLPFDQMTRQMLAGDLMLPSNTREWESAAWIRDDSASDLLLATGFLRNHRYDTGSGTIPAESKFENAADRLETVGTVFMGLTMQCARCHAHKYDPIALEDYYGMLSFFDRVPEVGSALRGASHPYIHTPTPDQRLELIDLDAEVARLESSFAEASRDLGDEQRRWEELLVESQSNDLRVARGLQHRYAVDGVRFESKIDEVEKPNDPVALCAGNREWSISFWFRPDEDAPNGAIFSSVNEPERYRQGLQADWIDGKLRVRHVCRWVNSYIEFESREQLEPGRWYHATFRCDGRMQGLAYDASLDGDDLAMVCTHPVTNDSAGNAGGAPLLLGGSPLLPGFRGELRDLRFYDRTLETAEVASLADDRDLAAFAAISPAKRSADEAAILRAAFLESEALPESIASLQSDLFAARQQLAEAIKETPTTMVMKDVWRDPTRVRLAGVYDSLGESVPALTPAFLPTSEPRAETLDRLDLANWMTSPDHPLTARVAVNRIWQWLWGAGFVDSPDNFGTQTPQPVHAELLDWLATEYIRLGWDTKELVRLIVTSRTFRQSSSGPERLWAEDPRNRHLARGPRYRLPVSSVRDQALALSGRLDPTVGGPPVVLDEVLAKDGKKVRLPYETVDNRRTLYAFWKRNSPHPMLAVFDVADRNQCDVRVHRTNTPLQALVTLNEPGLALAAAELGARAFAAGDSDTERLRWIWRACTAREPSQEEGALLAESLAQYRSLSQTGEAGAWTALANVLLNLDATLTLE